MIQTLYSTGYLGQRSFSSGKKTPSGVSGKIATFDAMVRRVGLLVCDIRLNPWSVAPCWRKEELSNRLGNAQYFPDGRYLHVPDLGNLNYKNGEEIKIRDLENGIGEVAESCQLTGLAPLLLCGCEDYDCCHRYTVGMAFAGKARRWCEITHWVDPTDVGRGTSEDVFGDVLTERWNGTEGGTNGGK